MGKEIHIEKENSFIDDFKVSFDIEDDKEVSINAE